MHASLSLSPNTPETGKYAGDGNVMSSESRVPKRHANSAAMLYPNTLGAGQMASLTALCDTFLPSIDATGLTADETLLKYYAVSASMAGAPQRLGGLLSSRLQHPKKGLLKLALWGLSTWYGTFLFAGFASLSAEFPYFQSFPELPQHRREQILRSWSRSSIFLLRLLYGSLKFLILLVFFSQSNEKGQNPSWNAIGYGGPDPDFKTRSFPEEDEDEDFGPLSSGIQYLNNPSDLLLRRGFHVSKISDSNKPRSPLTIRCDAVVVGSGSGGGVVAGVLARAGHKVLVLEKGDYCTRKNLTLLEGPSMDRMYLGGGLMSTDDNEVVILAGATVGGGSTINWSASFRTPAHVADEWRNKYRLELFGSATYHEALDAVCGRMRVQDEVAEEGFNNAVLRRGCEELGYPVVNIPRNAGADHYCGWCCLGCKDGRKQGVSETWLLDLVESRNGVILPGCEAVRVIHPREPGKDRSKAVGVAFEYRDSNGEREIGVVEAEVTVVACGALRTPTLLKASGLRNPNIGKHLHLHPVVMAWGYFPEADTETETKEDVLKGKKSFEGAIMTAMSTVAAEHGVVIQTPALHPGMFAALAPWLSGEDMKDQMRRFSRTAHVFALARDEGSGTVNPGNSVGYRMDAGDEARLQKGLEKVLRILAAAGAEEIGTQNVGGRRINVKRASALEVEKFVTEESKRAIRRHATPVCSAHQMGSCRMGTEPRTSAVDPSGETWEVEGLFVADASVFPTALGINPMVTVQAIAYCTAQSVLHILNKAKKT